MKNLMTFPGARLVVHALLVLVIWFAVTQFANWSDPLMNYYIALVAMYAIALFGMVILVGLSGQVSLGNGALMAVGGYVFALTSLHWKTVPLLGFEWNAVWSMIFAGLGGVIVGLLLGGVAARLRGPYLAGLTLGVAVGFPAIANRFPGVLGGDNGLILTVPYPPGGYADEIEGDSEEFSIDDLEGTEDVADSVDGSSEAAFDEDFTDDFAGDFDELTVDDFDQDFEELTVDDFEGDFEELTVDDFDQDFTEFETPVDEGTDLVDGGFEGVAELIDVGFVIERWQASVALAAAAIVAFIALNLVRGRQGRVWRAVRDDSVAAAVSGIFPAGAKVSAFVVSSVFAAISGAVLAQILAFVGPGAFGLGLSLFLLVGVVLGGRVSLVGALLGAVLLVWLPEFVLQLAGERGWSEQVTNNAPNLIYGLLVVLVVLLLPNGIMGSLYDLARKISGRAPKS
jgi:ABC-type branched-subunit amino acid transport system permease subunit